MSARENLKAKIAALRAKTTGAGCTEAEALSAAELAAKLMREHGFSEAELVMESAKSDGAYQRSPWRDVLDRAIAHATNTAILVDTRDGFTEYLGRAPGPEIAVYLRDVTTRAVERELRGFKASTWYKRRRTIKAKRAAAGDFCAGMAERLAIRILVLFRDTTDAKVAQEARAFLDSRHGGQLVNLPAVERTGRYDTARAAGAYAGQAVPLNHGVGGAGERKLIGGG